MDGPLAILKCVPLPIKTKALAHLAAFKCYIIVLVYILQGLF